MRISDRLSRASFLYKLVFFSLVFLLVGCVSNNVVTKEEVATQNRVDTAVSGILFDNDLDKEASYNIRKSGHVVIKFHESVSTKTYTRVVELMRNNKDIPSVYAEQGGVEVCKPFR